MKHLIPVLALLTSGCVFNHALVIVEADEPIRNAHLTLNGESVAVERTAANAFSAKWRGGEASGTLVVTFSDRAQSSCQVGYLEGSRYYRVEFTVVDRVCDYVSAD